MIREQEAKLNMGSLYGKCVRMITSYGIGEPLKNYKDLELIYGPTTAKKIVEEAKKNGKKRSGKKSGRNSKKTKDNT